MLWAVQVLKELLKLCRCRIKCHRNFFLIFVRWKAAHNRAVFKLYLTVDRKVGNSFARKLGNTKLQSYIQTSSPLLQLVLDPDFLQAVPFTRISYRELKQNKESIRHWRRGHWKHISELRNGNLHPSSLSPRSGCGEKSKWDATKTKALVSPAPPLLARKTTEEPKTPVLFHSH